MATVTIHDVDPALHARLQTMAAAHGRSLDDEILAILRSAVASAEDDVDIATRIRRRFEEFHREFGDPALDLPDRDQPVRAADFPE